MSDTIGFIGLGIMGKPMAANLLRNGCELLVYDVNPLSVDELRRPVLLPATRWILALLATSSLPCSPPALLSRRSCLAWMGSPAHCRRAVSWSI
jgi:hypothetical protein